MLAILVTYNGDEALLSDEIFKREIFSSPVGRNTISFSKYEDCD